MVCRGLGRAGLEPGRDAQCAGAQYHGPGQRLVPGNFGVRLEVIIFQRMTVDLGKVCGGRAAVGLTAESRVKTTWWPDPVTNLSVRGYSRVGRGASGLPPTLRTGTSVSKGMGHTAAGVPSGQVAGGAGRKDFA